MRHKTVQRNLYDYLNNALSEETKTDIERHLSKCTICSTEMKSLQSMLQSLKPSSLNPSSARPETYWQHFAEKVERRMEQRASESSTSAIREYIASLLQHRNPFALGFASALGIVLIGFFIWKGSFESVQQLEADRKQDADVKKAIPVAEARAYDYLERSKILLIGLVNVDPQVVEKSKINFAREREVSKELVKESRELTATLRDPSQQRLRQLVSELELILVQIANLESNNDSPAIEIVRNGVKRKGILLKINLEELERGGESKSSIKDISSQRSS